MFGYGWLNLGSLVLGLAAWILPVVSLVRQRKSWPLLSAASLGACGVSLCMQIFYTSHLVKIEDWAALMDTSGAVAFVSSVLLAVTVVLNVITVAVLHRKNR